MSRWAHDPVEHLAGLHAQIPAGPYIALWSRLRCYQPDRLSTMVESRELVRTALMRSTIHLVTPDDCMTLRPRTPGELGKALHERWPDRKPDTLAYAVRNLATLVQIPPRGIWGGTGRTVHASAETWLGRSIDPAPSIERLILRYLAAFGPASVRDVPAWCGLTRLNEVVDRMTLRVYLDEDGRELFDVPDAELPNPGITAPPRYLPEFDNVFLSHADRERIIPDGLSFAQWCRRYGLMMTVRGGVLRGNLLLGGLLQGIWRVDREKNAFTLVAEPFVKVSKKDLATLNKDGHALLTFAFPKAGTTGVQVLPNR